MTASYFLHFACRLSSRCGLILFLSIVALAQDAAPVLFTQSGTTRAIALESVTHAKEPFSTFTQIPFGVDNRTRIAIFARNAQLFAGETVSAFTANVQDVSGRIYPFAVENAVPLPQADGVTMLIVRVNEDLGDIGDVLLGISLRGMSSNRVRIGIGHVGGGPPDDTTPNEPPPTTGTRFKVMQWNVAYGRGTDNIVDVNRQATWMANQQVDLISLNEVPPENVSRYVDLLRQKTSVTWHSHWVAITPGNSVGQQILSRHPLASTGERYLSFGRSVARVTVSIGGKTINFFSTHLSYESASWRVTQLAEMNSWMAGFSEQRVVAGDYNLSPNWAEYTNMTAAYFDSWAQAFAAGTAVSYPDNPEGRTRKGRIDYINYSKFAGNLRLIEVKMPDQRDLNNHNVVVTVGNSNDWGVRPSDHNFLVTTFEVR